VTPDEIDQIERCAVGDAFTHVISAAAGFAEADRYHYRSQPSPG
jgi:hypothetical protein